ncbi:elongation factor P hydroxylase [Legionella sp. W05-934-2]|jgi:elongation factor P hydroxylase|uniref:elongation factor P hydroxylase n=1 Tax=Legionella sp. W05-934-2 TaxID=1198649 RepID=UPI003462021D
MEDCFQIDHQYQDLINIFHACFFKSHNTKLVRGGSEPIYLPADNQRPYHAIYFAHGYFSSALHEVSHWLIAGDKRRQLEDFGYWYVPDGRSESEQTLFEQVEAKPQALEWILSRACGYRFQISVDNLNGAPVDLAMFKKAILLQVKAYCMKGLPERARIFHEALALFYGRPLSFRIEDFQ